MEKKNYRPLTVLNAVDKVFEQLLSKQVVTNVDLHLSQNMSQLSDGLNKTHRRLETGY